MRHIKNTAATHPLTEVISESNGTEIRRLSAEAIKQLNEEQEFIKFRQEKRDKRLAKKEKLASQYSETGYTPWAD
jgi:predicted transcriptional regulator